jgi:L-threonylcarbamoyladenylate synthase
VALAERPPAAATSVDDEEALIAPGQLASHYAPRARLRLAAERVSAGEALLAFGPAPAGAERAVLTLNLSRDGDLIEAAANLFSHLRALDGCGAATIAVMPVPHEGLGEAINDRLRRAAAPRA